MRKLIDLITIILFFSFAAAGGIITAVSDPAELIKVISSDDPTAALQKTAAGGLPMSDKMNALYSRCAKLFGQTTFNGIYLDEEGERLIDLHSEMDTSAAEASAEAINKFHELSPELPAFVMLIPTASGIYRERLPETLRAADQQKLIDELYYDIDADIIPLDVYGSLYKVRDNYSYYRTDDRWTPQGAYAAYTAAIQKLGGTLYSVQNYDVEYTHVEFFGSLSDRSGIRQVQPDRINAYRCKFGSYVKSCDVTHSGSTDNRTSVYSRSGLMKNDKYSFFLGASDLSAAHIVTTAENMPKLLLIGSDYSHCFVPFLLPHYSEITLIDPAKLEDGQTVMELVSHTSFDQVLFLCDINTFCGNSGYDRLS